MLHTAFFVCVCRFCRWLRLATFVEWERERAQNNRHTDITNSQSLKVDSQWIFHVSGVSLHSEIFTFDNIYSLPLTNFLPEWDKTNSKLHVGQWMDLHLVHHHWRYLWNAKRNFFAAQSQFSFSSKNCLNCYRITVHLYHLVEIIQLWTLFWKQRREHKVQWTLLHANQITNIDFEHQKFASRCENTTFTGVFSFSVRLQPLT